MTAKIIQAIIMYTRSSAVAERLRDSSCHWIFC